GLDDARILSGLKLLLEPFALRAAGDLDEGWQPVERGEQLVLHRARPNDARPADHRRGAVAAFPGLAFLALERGDAAVREADRLRTVVGGEYDSGPEQTSPAYLATSALPFKADKAKQDRHDRFVPCVDGSELARLFFTFAGWSVQPCVRPNCAVHMTAGHNALRGSGPGQKPAFEMHWHKWVVLIAGSTGSALRAVGPSQPSHHAGCRRDRSRREYDGFLVAITAGHQGPRHSCDLVGERDRNDLGRPPRQQCGEPGVTFGAMDLGIADDG